MLVPTVTADGFDWRNVGGVNWNSPVKSQWGGTCWDYSTVSEYESKYMLTRNDSTFVPYLSVQQMMWDPPWNHYPLLPGMLGFDQILKYTTYHGLVSATELPLDTSHAETPDPGWALAAGWENRVWKTANYQWVSLDNLKNAIKTTGPIHMGFNADVAFKSVAALKANYKPLANNGDNHAVSLVGFKDDPTCPNGGYWIIKNSWNTTWGDNGYGYIPYGSSLDINQHTFSLGPVYYTGPMYHTGTWDATGHDYTGDDATMIWKGTASGVWNTSVTTNWAKKTTGSSFTWVNQELQAVFDSTGSNKVITVSGKAIAHGLTVSASGYSFMPLNSSSSITITAGGISTTDDLSFGSTPIYIGGPQSWNVAAGKTLTVAGPLHTIVSDLTFSGAGNTVISGPIDGGGVLNTNGAKPGGLIQAGTGTVTLSGTTNFSGNIAANSGALSIVVPGGGPGTFDGAWSGGGTVNIDCGGTFTLGGGASNFTGTLNWSQPVSLAFTPAAGLVSTFSGQINNNGSVTQNSPGTTVFADRTTNKNSYTGGTTIQQGVLQANIGNGIPTASYLTLDGGILQNYGTSTPNFTRALGTTGSTFAWTQNGGGFSAGSGPLAVNIPGGALLWSSDPADIGSKILGPLKLSCVNASSVTTLQNALNLNGADRTIQVEDNPSTTADNAVISGNITGTGGIVKSGSGWLKLTGANAYTGSTTIAGGILQATIGSSMGIPTNSMIKLDGGVLQFNDTASFTRTFGTDAGMIAWGPGGGGFSAGTTSLTVNIGNHASPDTLVWSDNPADVGTKIFGPLTLNAYTASNSLTFQNGLDLHGGARTLNIDANSATISGAIIDSAGGGSLTKNGVGTLYLTGSSGNTYSGTTTVNRGYVYLNKTSGYAIPGNLTMYSPVDTPGLWVEQSETFVIQQRANQFSPSCVLTFSNFNGNNFSHFSMGGFSTTFAGISGIGIVQNTESGTVSAATLIIDNSADYWFGGYLRNRASTGGGAISLVKEGNGTQTISGGGITYSGSTTISEGTLILENITNASLLARNITNNGTLGLGCTNGDVHPNFSGVISGTGGLIKTGGATVTISGSSGNTFAGPATITDGTLVLAKTSGYAIPGNITISNAYTYLVVQNPNQFPATSKISFTGTGDPHFEIYGNTVTVAGISGTVGGAIENTEGESGPGNGTLIVNNTDDCSYSSYIRDNAGGTGTISLVKSGPGKLTLPSSNSSYTGSTTVSNGVLEANSGKGLPVASFLGIDGGVLQSNGSSTVSFTRGLATSGSNKFQMTANGGGFSAGTGPMNISIGGSSGTVTWGDMVGTNLVGTLKFGSTSSANVTTFNNAIDLGSAIRTVHTVNNPGTTADYAVLAGIISGAGGLTKTGDGLLVLSKNNTYTDLTTVSNGTLQIGLSTSPSSGSITGNIFVDASGTFAVNRSGTVPFASKLSGTGTLIKSNSGTLTMTGNNSFSGNLTVNGGTLDYSGNSTLPSGNYTIAGGTLSIGSLTATSIGTFKITGGAVNGAGSLLSNSTYDIQGGTVNSILAGSVGLTKTGTGTATVNSPAYTGTTSVQAGILAFTGALPGGNYSISGGTLNIGSLSKTIGALQITGGTINGTGTLTSSSNYDIQGGVIGPVLGGSSGLVKTEDSVATLTSSNTYTGATLIQAGTLVLAAGGQIDPSSAIGNDATLLIADGEHSLGVINGKGSLLVGGSAQLSVTSLVQSTLVIGGDFSSLMGSNSFSGSSNAAVPEPGALALLASMVAVFAAMHFRRKR